MRSRLPASAGLWLAGFLAAVVPTHASRQAGGDAVIEVIDAARAPIRLIAPADGAALIAGTRERIAWIASGGSEVASFEEWEAFLSVDGGATYPLRLTPHLDREVAQFVFDVPDVESADARVLLRWGDEQHETAMALPARLRITRAGAILPVATPALSAPHRGEAALPGDGGVSAWTEGTRQGTARHLVVADRLGGAWGDIPDLTVGERGLAFVAPVDPQPQLQLASGAGAPRRSPPRLNRSPSPEPHHRPRSILALHQRLNA